MVRACNLSHSALHDGVEWNLRLERGRDPLAWQRLVDGFEAWWGRARRLDADWVAAYARRASAARLPLPPGEEEAEAPPPAPAPNPIQLEALAALARARTEERPRCLVVIPTGVGKTLLAALDVAAVAASTGTLPRVLFLAHREEILQQAGATFRRVLRDQWPGLRVSWFLGSRDLLDGDLVLASVQKLSLRQHLSRLAPDAFDYVVVDEVHHALAPSYLRVLDHLRPRFLLGLTATPERGDGASAASLFDDQVRYRADLGDASRRCHAA